MTIETFFKKLSKTPRKWKMPKKANSDGFRLLTLIRDGVEYCPLTAVLKEPRESGYAYSAKCQKELGLPYRLVLNIISAADYESPYEDYEQKLRARLLKACGLKEKK